MNKKVLLGMSGGIDSSVAAILLQKNGYRLYGVTFIFSGNEDSKQHHSVESARLLAGKLGIEHHVVDLRSEFKAQVINYFINDYASGNTPFPCAVCNPQLKFLNLEKVAKELSCDFISTGHYANITENNGIKYISTGSDGEKDQSFFLWGLKEKTINKLLLPLGNFSKDEVREIATGNGFENLNKKRESLGICFIKGNDYRKFLSDSGLESNPGKFVDSKGSIIGQHKGIFNYTVGQRRGLGLHLNKPVFVSEIRMETNEVVLSGFDEMYRSRIFLMNTHFVGKSEPKANKIYTVKIRYRLQKNSCRIIKLSDNKVVVDLMEPVSMVANGQTAVFYDGDRVIGGGFIESSE